MKWMSISGLETWAGPGNEARNIHNILHGSYFCWCNGPGYHIMLQVHISYGYYIFEGGSYFFQHALSAATIRINTVHYTLHVLQRSSPWI